jgi:hypothetical protein
MENFSLSINNEIKKEADQILYEKGLLKTLGGFGIPHVNGSYLLDLMTWRDLDVYLEADDLPGKKFFALGQEIESLLQPVKMSFRNDRISKTPGLPEGLYWGIYLGNERKGAWKIDVWAVNVHEYERLSGYSRSIQEKLNTEASRYIMEIKSNCWRDPEYRRSYNSSDIYSAVLEQKITTMEQFRKYLIQKKNLQIL